MSVLEKTLNELIARHFNIPVSMVTDEFIRKSRQALYADPNFRWPATHQGLRVISPLEAEEMRKRADAFLAQFV